MICKTHPHELSDNPAYGMKWPVFRPNSLICVKFNILYKILEPVTAVPYIYSTSASHENGRRIYFEHSFEFISTYS